MPSIDNNTKAFLELMRAGLWEKEARLWIYAEGGDCKTSRGHTGSRGKPETYIDNMDRSLIHKVSRFLHISVK